MSFQGYTYDPFGGLHQQTVQSNPRPTYDAPTYHTPSLAGTVNISAYHRGAIPGLGMELPSGGNGQNSQPWRDSTYGAAGQTQTGSFVDASGTTQIPSDGAAGPDEDDMDEGEIDEREIDDVYEPSFSQEPATAPNTYNSAGNQAPTSREQDGGSYSPFLTAQEVAVEQGEVVEDLELSQQGHLPPAESLANARKEAQDSILRLWSLNVRFQDYLEAGIDETILQDLFLGLGFDPKMATAKAASTALPTKITHGLPEKSFVQAAPTSAPTPPPTMALQKDAAETRKDRIARRLAATKATDQPALSPEPPKSTSTPKSQAPAASKINLDKSKLLQQKMEALKKAREAKVPTSGTSSDTGNGIATPQQMQQPSQSVHRASSNDTPPSQTEGTEVQDPAPIPRLPISSTPRQASATPSKRPLASDMNDASEEPFKRLFGQARQSQRLIIDVSDDEDDEAMDLDSPEMRPASVNKSNPSFKIPSFPEAQTGFLNRQMSSPMPTPSIVGGEDLESKVKDIEELKRKIAQREAEFKARSSRPASPSVNGSAFPIRAASATSGSAAPTPELNAATLSREPLTATPGPEYGSESQKLPKTSELRQSKRARSGRSHSRAASERLITESQAKRREKELKLHLMRNQIRKMEKEIQASVDTEERLKAEAEEESEAEEEEAQVEAMSIDALLNPTNASTTQEVQVSGPPPAVTPLTSAEDPATTLWSDPAEAHQEDLESDAVAAVRPVEENADVVNEHIDHSEESRIYDSEESRIYDSEESRIYDSEESRIYDSEESEAERQSDGEVSVGERLESSDQRADVFSRAEEAMADHEEPQESPNAEAEPSSSSDSSEGWEGLHVHAEETLQGALEAATAAQVEAEEQSPSSDGEIPDVRESSPPMAQSIPAGQAESGPASPRELRQASAQISDQPRPASGSSFVPYESALKQFRAYRFHPDFSNSVAGGLRSLTYSNEIDPKLPFCPDELAGAQCPRGADCIYQHFDNMQAADDQILMQLGGYGSFEGEQKQEFDNGLRQILTDARANKIRDFDTLAKSIIDYRASFLKDPTKVLPLGEVKL